jgi:hypothetical protein
MRASRSPSGEWSSSMIGGSELMERLLAVRRRKLAFGGLVARRVRGHFPGAQVRRRRYSS